MGWDTDPPFASIILGLTRSRHGGSDVTSVCTTESDIIMNDRDHTWSTGTPGPGEKDAYSVLLHESGHMLGLGHSHDRDATMYASYSAGEHHPPEPGRPWRHLLALPPSPD